MNDKNDDDIIKILTISNKIAIFGHENPDWDCIGSMLWLWWLLEKQWKQVLYFTPNPVSKIFSFIDWIEKIKSNFDYGKYDAFVFVDFSGYKRIDTITYMHEWYFDLNKLIVIDHHLWNDLPMYAIVYKDVSVMSVCELIFEITYSVWNKYYDSKIATYLYIWLLTDSGVFRYDRLLDQSKRLFSNSLQLLELWADKSYLIKNIFSSKRFEAVEFMQLLISRMKYIWAVLYTYFDQEELKQKSIDEEEAIYAQFIMQEIAGPRIVIVFKIFSSYIKWSIRTNDFSTDCEKVAVHFWWWWHKAAAWFKIKCDSNFLESIRLTVEIIQGMI